MESMVGFSVLLFLGYFCMVCRAEQTYVTSCIVSDLVVNTEDGYVQGLISDGYRQFRGIPFAEPPVGELRWMSPQPNNPWKPKVLSAKTYKASCYQNCGLPNKILCPTNISEDCLHLNVFTPLNVSMDSKLPVMVFIYGGGYIQGTSLTPMYNTSHIVATNAIAVTFEYRLNAFGFLVTGPLKGNYGIEDQRAVLQWVQRNIGNFGGDPQSVTLFGESAGGMSTSVHLTSPLSKGLFSKVIIESDPLSLEIPNEPQSIIRAEIFSTVLLCDVKDTDCLRSKSADEVLNAAGYTIDPPDLFNFTFEQILQWRPVLSPGDIDDQILDSMNAGHFNHVPIVIGTNNNEGTTFVDKAVPFLDNIAVEAVVELIFKDAASKVLDFYPLPSSPLTDTRQLFASMMTDYLFACPSRRLAEIADQFGVPVHVYHFDEVSKHAGQFWGNGFKFCWDRVCHGSELPYVFNTAAQIGIPPTPEEQKLADAMTGYWTNMAHTSNPNNGPTKNLVVWPQFTLKNKQNILLKEPGLAPESYLEETCNFWDKLGYFF